MCNIWSSARVPVMRTAADLGWCVLQRIEESSRGILLTSARVYNPNIPPPPVRSFHSSGKGAPSGGITMKNKGVVYFRLSRLETDLDRITRSLVTSLLARRQFGRCFDELRFLLMTQTTRRKGKKGSMFWNAPLWPVRISVKKKKKKCIPLLKPLSQPTLYKSTNYCRFSSIVRNVKHTSFQK